MSTEREDFIRNSFENQEVYFSYPHNLDDFNYLVGNFTQDKSESVDSEMGEQLTVNRLIIMDDVSGLADKSEEFSKFLTVSRKYGSMPLCISYNISWQTKLENDNVRQIFLTFFLALFTEAEY